MRSQIIEMLDFPRRVLRGHVAIETCPHAGNFSERDAECRACDTRLECEWLFHNDEFVTLTAKPTGALLGALGSAALYVDRCMIRAGHVRGACSCDACAWLRGARELCEESLAEEVPGA